MAHFGKLLSFISVAQEFNEKFCSLKILSGDNGQRKDQIWVLS